MINCVSDMEFTLIPTTLVEAENSFAVLPVRLQVNLERSETFQLHTMKGMLFIIHNLNKFCQYGLDITPFHRTVALHLLCKHIPVSATSVIKALAYHILLNLLVVIFQLVTKAHIYLPFQSSHSDLVKPYFSRICFIDLWMFLR